MEIRSVTNEVRHEYPKMEQISKKHLSNSIPKKWLKTGLTSLIIAVLMKNNSFAESTIDLSPKTADIAGGLQATVPLPVKICETICPITQALSAVMFIITGLYILLTKIKAKKQGKTKKAKKWIKILFIISIVLFIISLLAKYIINT